MPRAAPLPSAPSGSIGQALLPSARAASDAGGACLSGYDAGRIGLSVTLADGLARWWQLISQRSPNPLPSLPQLVAPPVVAGKVYRSLSLLRTSCTGYYRVAWDTVSHGIPSHGTRVAQGSTSLGYRVAWDTARSHAMLSQGTRVARRMGYCVA